MGEFRQKSSAATSGALCTRAIDREVRTTDRGAARSLAYLSTGQQRGKIVVLGLTDLQARPGDNVFYSTCMGVAAGGLKMTP